MHKNMKLLVYPNIILINLTINSNLHADQVINDDLIVTSSACIGSGCEDGEDFSKSNSDTLRIKESNPSIRFTDTSSSGSFPSNDWRVGTTSSSSTKSIFYVEDIDGGQMALQIESGVNGGVALGTGSTLESGTVSVGSAGFERRITNVADGIADTDAVNVRQFNAYKAQVDTFLTSGGFEDTLNSVTNRQITLEQRLNTLSSDIDRVTATAAAFSAVQANPKAKGSTQIGFGVGHYSGEGSAAIGLYQYSASNQVMFNIGMASSMDGGNVASRAGVTFGW